MEVIQCGEYDKAGGARSACLIESAAYGATVSAVDTFVRLNDA